VNDVIATSARASALRLAAEFGPGLPADVEAALHARETVPRLEQYIDPVSLGGLIVSIATLAWTVYTGLRKTTPDPSSDVIARTVRVELRTRGDAAADAASQERMIEVIVNETLKHAGHAEPADDGSGDPGRLAH
jgi:hypothetical protein